MFLLDEFSEHVVDAELVNVNLRRIGEMLVNMSRERIPLVHERMNICVGCKRSDQLCMGIARVIWNEEFQIS